MPPRIVTPTFRGIELLVARASLSGVASPYTISFSGITKRNVIIDLNAISDYAVSSDHIKFQPNGDTVAANYLGNDTFWHSSGISTSGLSVLGLDCEITSLFSTVDDYPSHYNILLCNVNQTDLKKAIMVDGIVTIDASEVNTHSISLRGYWENNTAITGVNLKLTNGVNFAPFSNFAVYGYD